jgi:pentatricopeptide repeat protein
LFNLYMDDDDVSPDARDVYVANATVSSYFAASDVASVDRLFAEVSTDVVAWTTMVAGHASSGGLGRARHFFDAMPERNIVSWNAMLRAYARAGMLTEARDLFDAMPTRNAATWSCMISGLVLSGRCWEALRDQGLFGDMVRSSGIVPNEPALVSVVSACAQLRSLEHGAWVHAYDEQELQGAMSVVLASAIVDMYMKCGGYPQCHQGVCCHAHEEHLLLERDDCWARDEWWPTTGPVALVVSWRPCISSRACPWSHTLAYGAH